MIRPTNPVDVGEDLNSATYSADGSRIFYQRWFPDSIQLWVMNADGSDPHEFFPEPGPGWDGVALPSPDGRWVAYWHVIQDGRATQRVSVVRADGTGQIIPTGPDLLGTAELHLVPGFDQDPDDPEQWEQPVGIPARPSRWSVDDGAVAIGRRYRLAAPRALIHAGARPRRSPDKKEPRVVGPGVQGVCGLVAGRGFEPLTFGL